MNSKLKSACAAHSDAAGSLMLRTEALSALCGLAKNYTAALISSWAAISHAVAYNLKKQGSGLGNPAVTPREQHVMLTL